MSIFEAWKALIRITTTLEIALIGEFFSPGCTVHLDVQSPPRRRALHLNAMPPRERAVNSITIARA
jgi:hypothetical protein